ncbi:MAG: sulfur oxidation c-type cytochrome SoxX [Steroidobacteraceae bacterium]
MKTIRHPIRNRCLAVVCLCAFGVATVADDRTETPVKKVMEKSFAAKGQATLARLDQDRTQTLCTRYAATPIPPKTAAQITEINLATIRYPTDGQYLGDWKSGEQIAQTGVGKQFSDDPAQPSGGNCYACHQVTKAEIAYGNLGPSLYNYGKLRGNSEAIKKYTWGKVFNADAYSACSSMPRFGHMGILTESQIKDVMALLLDPKSPVNE